MIYTAKKRFIQWENQCNIYPSLRNKCLFPSKTTAAHQQKEKATNKPLVFIPQNQKNAFQQAEGFSKNSPRRRGVSTSFEALRINAFIGLSHEDFELPWLQPGILQLDWAEGCPKWSGLMVARLLFSHSFLRPRLGCL